MEAPSRLAGDAGQAGAGEVSEVTHQATLESAEDAIKRLLAARAEQGLPAKADDPGTLEAIAATLRDHQAQAVRRTRRGVA